MVGTYRTYTLINVILLYSLLVNKLRNAINGLERLEQCVEK